MSDKVQKPKRVKKKNEPIEMGGVIIHPGSRIGNYIFLREVGSGGMARVLLAKDPAGELVALKVLRKSRFKTGLARFRREFRALSRINHPNVVRVEAYGDLFGHPYIAMEFVDGPDLHSQIRQFRNWDWTQRWQRVEEVLIDLCRALSAVHRRGLVHRDLKPSNVLITKDHVCKLTDFGIVKDLDPSNDPMMSTTLVGTWAYASPEQITGSPIDHRSDLYSLGVILFAMLTGKRPFVANDMAGYLALHRDRPAPAARAVNRRIPAHLDEICRRLLQKSSRDRYQSAQEILYRLEAEEREPSTALDGHYLPPLVGRDLELEALTDAVAGLTARRGGVIIVEGEDGAGKSRLLETAIDRCRSLGIPHHRLEFLPEAPIFSNILKLSRDMAKELGNRTPPELRQALLTFSEGRRSRGNSRYTLFDGAREALDVLLEDAPQVLILDDLHEANSHALEFICYVIRGLIATDRRALLVIASLRPKANPMADALAQGDELGLEPQHIAVGTLSRQDLATIILDLVGDSRSARMLAQRIHRETEGNAYFVTEFLRSLMGKGVIKKQEDGTHKLTVEAEEISTGHLEIPLGVRQMMKSRLEGVRTEDRDVLEVLAVGGREVDLEVILDVLEAEEESVLDALDRLLAAGIIRERRANELTFYAVTHRKFADVVYRDLQAERRANLHRKMAAALELHYSQNLAALEIVGEHYRRAGDAGSAFGYLVAAAKRLSDRSLVQEAWSLTEKAGALEDSARADLPRAEFRRFRRDNLIVRASVLYNRAEWADAESAYRAVLAMAEEDNDSRVLCEARQLLATVLRRRDKHSESWLVAEQALEESRKLHYRRGVAEALHCMAALAWSESNLDDCERLANEGLVVAQGTQLAEQRAELLLALTAAQATRGHLASATSGLTEAEGIFRELRKKRHRCLALANIAELLTWQGEPLQARQRAHVAVQVATDLDYKLGRTAALRAMGVAAIDLGLYEEAQQVLRDALETAREIQLPEEILACLVALTHISVEQNNLTNALDYATMGMQTASKRDPERFLPLLSAHLARAHAGEDQEEAKQLLQSAASVTPELPVPRRSQTQIALTWAYLAVGDTEAARKQARSVLQLAGSRGFRLVSLEARALMTQISTGEEQATHRAVGQELARDFTHGMPPEMMRAFSRRPFLPYLDDDDFEDL
jgi:serine/threonine protein kinase